MVYTDGGAALRPGEGAVASWGFVAVLMCGNEAVCVCLVVRPGRSCCKDPTFSFKESPN